MDELLEATKKIMKYFKRSLKHIPLHPNNTDHHPCNASTSHSDNHKCNSHYHKDKVIKITSDNYIPKHITTETDDIPDNTKVYTSNSNMDSALDSKWLFWEHQVIQVKLSDSKNVANFQVKIHNKQMVSLFDIGATISCMSIVCFDNLDLKPHSLTKCIYRVNGADGNSLGPLSTTTCTLRVSQKVSATVHSL